MDDGIAHPAAAVAGTTAAQPFTRRQVLILRAMAAIMGLTVIGGGALVVTALVWKLRQAPAVSAGVSTAEIRRLAESQPGVSFVESVLPPGAKLLSTHLDGDVIILIYEDAGGVTLARFDHKAWKLSGLARLSAQATPK